MGDINQLCNYIFSIIGFLLGVTAAGSAGYYYLLGEYNNASAALLLSVQELQASTDKVKRKRERDVRMCKLLIYACDRSRIMHVVLKQ